jgi:hypothetical protein
MVKMRKRLHDRYSPWPMTVSANLLRKNSEKE